MFTAKKGRLAAVAAVAVGAVVALAGCASSNPLGTGSNASSAPTTLVVGSQDYYSNEIIAEIYAQALESNGFTVDRQFRIGQREVYLPELKSGSIDVFPEYTGSLLQALDKAAAGGTSDAVHDQLVKALPSGLTALDKSDASDQNSWTATQAFVDTYKLTDLASLKNVTEPITVGGNSELETRPYGPTALKDKYGITIAGFVPVEDNGGPLTVKALVDNKIQLANIYTADPNIKSNNLVALSDPDGLFFPDNVVPIVSSKVDEKAASVLNKISAAMTAADLVSLNAQSVNDKESADKIASAWLAQAKLF
ncbi:MULTISPECIES: ABC transporter substrate-binding protein [unclassified Cryobacterium]|uniref:ABC transporter substrate-binding protein n=1 Tax=unclassified Cryobacterium TaxID=2649013 RepID=UPI002AB54759|nr:MULTISPECIES: ABC transporter substrate-binding protein [unclassified Cryobacterium]MDY7527569.1 ABC transporter substrate-binding protein [Cryobacterium sp. 10C2]MDY7556650.1 ABC transporter substrate-binding protein [Cryobacterium sp. 10C3]MEB0001650.1 ABC transporter substrate-binding protein [Cryobacterium sp. RTC2.1]MEB0201958.1 ABC transporter substrate-binding protein [Cryobacterium sp. 5I3]MEB0286906.1 ABC transporter substrate-binding protein [Cryobacterium sp. 10S3]